MFHAPHASTAGCKHRLGEQEKAIWDQPASVGNAIPKAEPAPQNSSILLPRSLAQVESSPSAALTAKEDDSFLTQPELPEESSMEGCLGDCGELPDDWVSHHPGTCQKGDLSPARCYQTFLEGTPGLCTERVNQAQRGS